MPHENRTSRARSRPSAGTAGTAGLFWLRKARNSAGAATGAGGLRLLVFLLLCCARLWRRGWRGPSTLLTR